jgi:glycine/D-amino acid oxidase-like deaminating enzyme
LWSATAEAAPETDSLVGDVSADVVIVGAGFTGLSAALHLAEAGRSVVVVETKVIGWGASGRNGGQVNPAFDVLPSGVRAHYGEARGNRVLALVDSACDLVFDLIKRHGIQCAHRRVPYLRGAYGKRGIAGVKRWVQEWNDYGAPVTFNSKQITEQTTGSSFFDASMEDARGGSLQPLSYVRGLARAALAAGVKIYTHSPADCIQITGNDWQLTTQNGKVTARHLLVCTNGYTGDLWTGLKQNVVPVASLQVATEPLVDDLRSRILPKGHHVSETRRSMTYFRIGENGRFQIGGRGSLFDATSQHADTAHLKAEAICMYPELALVKWDFEWGGLVAITKTKMPLLLNLDANAHAGFGYNGRGVALASSMGQQLARLVLGEDAPMLQQRARHLCSMPFAILALHGICLRVTFWTVLTGNRCIFGLG